MLEVSIKFEISKETVRLDTGFVLNVNGLEYHVLEPKDITSSDNTTVVVASSVGSEYNLYLQTDFEITKNFEEVGITKATVVEGFDNGVGVETDDELSSVGSEYNLYLQTDFEITKNFEEVGITKATVVEGFDNGVGVETDDELRERFFLTQRNNATSGNAEHYRQWALEVDGVYGAKFDNGVGVETDDELRERFFLTQRNNATSGNAEHYRQWALEVDGVYGAKVTPLWAGPGTVKVQCN